MDVESPNRDGSSFQHLSLISISHEVNRLVFAFIENKDLVTITYGTIVDSVRSFSTIAPKFGETVLRAGAC